MRLEAPPGPDPLDRGRRDPDLLCHCPAAPMRFTGRLFVLGEADDLLDLVRRDPRLTAAPFTDLAELGEPLTGEPAPPRADRHWGNPNGRGDLRVSHNVGGHQQHLGPFHLTMGRGRGPGQYGQRLTLTGGHDQWGCSIVHVNSLPRSGYLFWRHTTSSLGHGGIAAVASASGRRV